MITRKHLTLLSGGDGVPLVPVAPVSPHRLAITVVQAAQRYAAEVDRTGLEDEATTAEQLARRDLLDAVFTLEWHQIAPDREHEAR